VDTKKAIPFFSIKWKTLLIFGLLLAVSHCVQYLIGYNQIINQFDSQRNREHQYQLAIVHDLIEQSARLMEQTIETIPLVAQSLGQPQDGFGIVISALEQHWENLQTNWGLSALIFYNPNHELIARWGRDSPDLISDKQLKKAFQSEAPSFQLSCSTQCYQVVFIPTLAEHRNKSHGLIVLVRSLADVIIAFESTTNIDIAILKPSQKSKDNSTGKLKITASSHSKRTNQLLTKLQLQYSDDALINGEIITQVEGLEIGTRLFKLTKGNHSNSPYLLLTTDLTEQYQLIAQAKRQSLYTVLVALLISVLLLFGILLRQAQRVISVSRVLPALTKGAFQQVRSVLFNSLNRPKWSRDELDLLEESTLLVTNQLEESNKLVYEKTAELTAQNKKIAQEHGFINELLDTAPVIIMTQTISGEIISINRQGCELLHTNPNQLIGRQFEETLASPLSKEKWHILDDLRRGKLELLRQEASIKDPQRGIRTISWTHKYLVTQDSETVTTLTIGQDVTEQKDAEAHLVWIADHDPLTNLFNRRRFQSEFEQQLKIAERYQNKGAVLYFDLDQFKYVNDTSGHTAGDKLLKKVAETLQQVVRTSDTLARLGGDEFALLIPETGAEGASLLAQKIMGKLRAIEFQSDGNIHNISASIGISIFPEHGSTVQDFMSNADLAMYQAKEAGRGRWHLFTPEDQAKELLKVRVLWKEKIETALENERFILHYQPILDIKSNKISHAEALVRMIGCNGEVIMPNDFIPTAEHTGLIDQLDITVLKLAFETLRTLRAANNPLKLSVNLSGRAFSNPELIRFLKEGLNESDIDAEKLIFEVTETTAVANFSAAKEMMSEIKKTGAKFALDDFGVGYASFYYLRQLPVDYVKIDGSFIRQLAKHKEDQVLVQAIAEISRISGKQTIAEFVEDQAILDLIETYGIDYAQGYHIAKPSAEIPF
jgi:diguanylate cyclase (GGDEF)-like protein/PAS domain S-box-containing protein